MGSAFFIVLEKNIDGLDTMMNGKSLSKNSDALDAAARELGVPPLLEFYSIAPEEAIAFMEGEGVDVGDMKLPPLRQFSAAEGLATVRALLTRPEGQPEGVAEDLRDCERILSAAEKHGIGWHFEIDI
jgi:hypothetical protein